MNYIWKHDLSATEWDRNLAILGGHPLQSSLWGDARLKVDGIKYHRWAAFEGDELVWMVRFEERRIVRMMRGAWAPKCLACPPDVHIEFLSLLREQGYLLCIEDVYSPFVVSSTAGDSTAVRPKTILIDLKKGRDGVLADIDKQWRYGVRAAERAGVVVEQSSRKEDIVQFFAKCGEISKKKSFALPGSEQLVMALLCDVSTPDTEAQLFLARSEGCIAAGALVLRCGKTLHYFWGTSDRTFSKQRPGEAVQWGVIEWAIEQGLETYDLEGIDPVHNNGVSAFKRKMGGVEVEMAGMYSHPLNLRGRLALKAGTLLHKI